MANPVIFSFSCISSSFTLSANKLTSMSRRRVHQTPAARHRVPSLSGETQGIKHDIDNLVKHASRCAIWHLLCTSALFTRRKYKSIKCARRRPMQRAVFQKQWVLEGYKVLVIEQRGNWLPPFGFDNFLDCFGLLNCGLLSIEAIPCNARPFVIYFALEID